MFLVTFILIAINFVQTKTILAPVDSGSYTEGVVGQPVFLNPVLTGQTGTDADINRLVFASLKDIIDTYSISDDHKVITLRIKGGLVWQDNQPLTTDDVIFTVEAIQDADTASPLYSSWKGVKVERTSEREMKITLPSPYVYFENIMLSLQPIPKHIYGSIPFANMKLSDYRLQPVSSGAFNFNGYQKTAIGFITKINLQRNNNFPGSHPHLDSFNFNFYETEANLIKAFNSGDVDGFAMSNAKNLSKVYIPGQIRKIRVPQYYAVFLDSQNNALLGDPSIKAALNYATDKNKVVSDVFNGYAFPVDSPIFLPNPKDNNSNNGYDASAEFSIDRANQILDAAGWTMGDDGVRQIKDKLTTKRLEFGLTVYPNDSSAAAAKILQANWAQIGVKVNISSPAPADFESNILKPRNYEMLLFGNIYDENMDPFSFWHSSQKFYPGLNLSLYQSSYADSLIGSIRSEFNTDQRDQDLTALGANIKNDQPAVFLFSPYYIYVSSKTLHGFDDTYLASPGDRFTNIKNWYVRTARVLK